MVQSIYTINWAKLILIGAILIMNMANALGQAFYRTVRVHDLDIFYREAGPKDGPVILLLRGAVIVAIFRCS